MPKAKKRVSRMTRVNWQASYYQKKYGYSRSKAMKTAHAHITDADR